MKIYTVSLLIYTVSLSYQFNVWVIAVQCLVWKRMFKGVHLIFIDEPDE